MSSWKTHPRLMIPIQFQSIVGFDLMVLNQFVGESSINRRGLSSSKVSLWIEML